MSSASMYFFKNNKLDDVSLDFAKISATDHIFQPIFYSLFF
jgi:hypothetical protein